MRSLAIGIVALALLAIAGCGDFGATEDELHAARHRGEEAARATAQQEIARARRGGYGDGFTDGESFAYEFDEELEEEIEEEVEAEESSYEGEFEPTPEKINGEDSYEFEPDDLERAEEADKELREYCAGAVSEAQELGCLSHAEVP